MAKHADRINSFSYSGADPEIEISNEQWEVLERTYRHSLSESHRGEITALINRYLFSRRSELGAARQKDVTDIASDALRAISGFSHFAHGMYPEFTKAERGSDEVSEHNTRFALVAERTEHLVRLHPGSLTTLDGEPVEINQWQYCVRLSLPLLSDIAIALVGVLRSVARGDEAIVGFRQLDAYKRFLLGMKLWAKAQHLPVATYNANKTEAGPISELCFELTKLFPKPFDIRAGSAKSVAALIEKQHQAHRKAEAKANANSEKEAHSRDF